MLQRVYPRDVEGVPARCGGCTREMWRVHLRDVEGAPARHRAITDYDYSYYAHPQNGEKCL